MTDASLAQGVGYGLILGVGTVFTLGMIATTYCLKRYSDDIMTAEEFSTAGRSVPSSLIAVGVISSWCWPTAILMSTAQVYNYGVCGGIYFAAGCGSVIYLFALLAVEVKRKAPGCHTYLELIKIRYGSHAHWVYIFFGLAVNIIITVELINGASAVFHFLTGMHIVAASFLAIIPVGIYTLFGGLKATFLTDYVHTVIMLVIALVFAFSAYVTNPNIGSPGKMYDLLKAVSEKNPIEGNQDGSLMTLRSTGGGLFLLIALSSVLAPIVLDQGYWNKALASSPESVLPGYVMGGLSWFAIPFGLATVMGLSMRVLENTDIFPYSLSQAQVNAGLVLPSASIALMGKTGACLAFLLVFMSVTSAASAEMVSASTVICYDIYRTYLNPHATNRQLISVTHLSVVGFNLGMIGFSIGLYYAGVDLAFLFDLIAVICGGAFVPASITLFWSGLNKWSMIFSPILGTASGVAAYLATAAGLFDGKITVAILNTSYPGIAGMLVSSLSPIVYIAVIQLFTKSDNYDFELMKHYNMEPEPELSSQDSVLEEELFKEPKSQVIESQETQPKQSLSLFKKRLICVLIPLAFLIVWPMPMYGSKYVFSRKFFTGWVTVSFIWIWISLFLVGVLPLWQGRSAILRTARGIKADISALVHSK